MQDKIPKERTCFLEMMESTSLWHQLLSGDTHFGENVVAKWQILPDL
jgi:hypothetical protein